MYVADTYNKFILTSPWLNKVDAHRVLIAGRILNAPTIEDYTINRIPTVKSD